MKDLPSKADMIRDAADKYGAHNGNNFLIDKIYTKYKVKVCPSQVTNTLGRLDTRDRGISPAIRTAARSFAALCDFDKRVMYRAIRRYC